MSLRLSCASRLPRGPHNSSSGALSIPCHLFQDRYLSLSADDSLCRWGRKEGWLSKAPTQHSEATSAQERPSSPAMLLCPRVPRDCVVCLLLTPLPLSKGKKQAYISSKGTTNLLSSDSFRSSLHARRSWSATSSQGFVLGTHRCITWDI